MYMEASGIVDLPDGRKVLATVSYHRESDTNAVILDDMSAEWIGEGGHDLTEEDYNIEVQADGQTWHLHEFIWHRSEEWESHPSEVEDYWDIWNS